MKQTTLLFFIIILCSIFIFCKTTDQSRRITAEQLIGNWETRKGDVEEVAFSVEQGENIYSSYLHGRLFETGTWEFQGNTLTINLDTGDSTVYVNVTITGDILTLRTEDGEESEYKKITSYK